MAFDYSTLIIDRAASDSDALRALVKKPMSQWTAAEAEAFTAATLKGSYDYTDLNRVSACMEDLVARLNGLGYQVPGYERVKIERTVKPDDVAKLRYLRMTITALRGNTNVVQLSEIRLLSKNGSVMEWPQGTTVTASINATGDGESPDKLIDGSTDTKFCSTQFASGMQINIDLGDKVLDRTEYTSWQWLTANDSPERDPVTFELSGSEDGQTFTVMDSASNAGITETRKSLAYSGSIGVLPNGYTGDEPSDSDTDALDPYLWYPEDSPTQPQIEHYRGNVAAVRTVLYMPDTTPEVPETLRKLHTNDVNNIEAILIAIDLILTHIPAARRHCGVTVCGLKGVIA